MEVGSSKAPLHSARQPKSVRVDRPAGPPPRRPPAAARRPVTEVDDVDRRLLRELARDARIPNNALAELAGIAPSTCLGRVRALRERGVIRGYHAEVDPERLGLGVLSLVSVLPSDSMNQAATVRRGPVV